MLNRACSTLVAVYISCVFFISACATAQANHEALDESLKSYLGSEYILDQNVSKTFVLYQQKAVNDHSSRTFKFVVVRVSDNKFLLKGSFRNGYVKWMTDDSIEVATSRDRDSLDKKIIKVDHQS